MRKPDPAAGLALIGLAAVLPFATLLTQDPPLCLLDEPSNHLDLHQQIAVLDLLRARARVPP